jgi:ectoine hydroxylase-related dioxygenase (phytanoyl-CoA dioxygenase family)
MNQDQADCRNMLRARGAISASALQNLLDAGFIVISGPVAGERVAQLAAAYDSVIENAPSGDVSISRSTTRVHDLVNHGLLFDELYLFRPVIEACCHVINEPFKLSAMLARTVHPHSPAQPLHVDCKRDGKGSGMVGFIIMLDEFRSDNGATRFVPGSQQMLRSPEEMMIDTSADHEDQVLACGEAGSLILYDGSVWHGHSANRTDQPRRSIQGAFIPRSRRAAIDQRARIRPETLGRIGSLARYLLDLEPDVQIQ